MNIFQSPSNCWDSSTLFGTNMQSHNEFHLQPNSFSLLEIFTGGGVTLNPSWQKGVDHHLDQDESTLQLRWHFGVKSTSNFLQWYNYDEII